MDRDEIKLSKEHMWAYNVLDMVRVLHERGYGLLRIMPGRSPSGMHWRCAVTHRRNIQADHGAKVVEFDLDTAHYTSGSNNDYFDWKDARQDMSEDLADKFLERFAGICGLGLGEDREYVRWYLEMLDFAKRGAFPVAYEDSWEDDDPQWLATTEKTKSGLRMPPRGGGVELP